LKVTIITVVFNAAHTIRDCIDSVLAQSHQDIEYIVIDGASSDDTASIVKSYGPQITHFVSEPDRGIYDAMNKGIALATGEVVGILNADDMYINTAVIETVVNKITENQADALYADLIFVAKNNTNKIARYWKSEDYDLKRFLYGWMPPHPTFFVKRKYYEKFGTFRVDFGSAADYELLVRFCYKHQLKVIYFPQIIIKMRLGGISTKSLKSRIAANKYDKLTWVSNGLKAFWFTSYLKPIRKITQFFVRPNSNFY
jgi:glycosyltransferase involved in cell wall biosynthesis